MALHRFDEFSDRDPPGTKDAPALFEQTREANERRGMGAKNQPWEPKDRSPLLSKFGRLPTPGCDPEHVPEIARRRGERGAPQQAEGQVFQNRVEPVSL